MAFHNTIINAICRPEAFRLFRSISTLFNKHFPLPIAIFFPQECSLALLLHGSKVKVQLHLELNLILLATPLESTNH